MTCYEIIILDYGPRKDKTKVVVVDNLRIAIEIFDKYQKRYKNVRMQKVVTTWVR